MTNLKCFAIAGLKLWFWPDDHEPPHFHAKRNGEWEYKINFLEDDAMMFEEYWTNKKAGMSRQDKEQIIGMVNAHRLAILQEWEKIHS